MKKALRLVGAWILLSILILLVYKTYLNIRYEPKDPATNEMIEKYTPIPPRQTTDYNYNVPGAGKL